MKGSSSDMTGTMTVGTTDWVEITRGVTIGAYVPGDSMSADISAKKAQPPERDSSSKLPHEDA